MCSSSSNHSPAWSGATRSLIIRSIPQLAQSQNALCDQLSMLWLAANKLGLYDAADFIRPHMARPEENSGMAFHPEDRTKQKSQ